MKNEAGLRSPEVSGLFYPSDPGELRETVEDLLLQSRTASGESGVIGLVSPHAGYKYSGSTAARGYAAIRDLPYDRVVIVAPSHREAFRGVSVYPGNAYSTPLGAVPVDGELRDRIVRESHSVRATDAGHRGEHAVEVQLPFLQAVLAPFSFLPLVMGEQSRALCFELGRALAVALNGMRALLVASTDLSHYHNDTVARRLDQVVVRDLSRFDPEALMNHLEQGEAEACGGGPTVAVLTALKFLGASRMTVLHHSTSADTTGDVTSVVGYVSAAAYA